MPGHGLNRNSRARPDEQEALLLTLGRVTQMVECLAESDHLLIDHAHGFVDPTESGLGTVRAGYFGIDPLDRGCEGLLVFLSADLQDGQVS